MGENCCKRNMAPKVWAVIGVCVTAATLLTFMFQQSQYPVDQLSFVDSEETDNRIRCALSSNAESTGRTAMLRQSFVANDFRTSFTIDESLPTWITKGELFTPNGTKLFTFAVDAADACLLGPHHRAVIREVDAFFKSSLNDEISLGADAPFGNSPSRAVHLDIVAEYRYKILPFVFQNDMGVSWNPSASTESRTSVLVSQSLNMFSETLFGKTRTELYQVMKQLFPNDPSLLDFHVSINPDKQTTLLFKSSLLDETDNIAHDKLKYWKFVSHGWFLLNLSGNGGSQPFRLQDACITDTALVSDHIYAIGYRSFPRFAIPADVQRGLYSPSGINDALKCLFQNYQQVYNFLLARQRKWCHVYFSAVGHAHQILSRIPSKYFAYQLLSDQDLYDSYYGSSTTPPVGESVPTGPMNCSQYLLPGSQ
eukprot:GILK01007290.1.p1 GENE.GILK01007290.1~~GILK01007290.1.p1  ORF type:complete len:424 (-),score=44.49 GILK01007290.1:321-1592(-)